MIRDLEPSIPENQQQREKLMRWIHLLVDPLTSTQDIEFRQKRNRYLFMICASLMTGSHIDFIKIIGGKHIKFDAKKKPVRVAGIATPERPDPIADVQGIPFSITKALDPKLFEASPTFFEWQREKCWDVRLQKIQEAEKIILSDPKMRIHSKKPEKLCTVHITADKCPCTNVEKKVGQCLDNQFKYLLSLAESYQLLMEKDTEIINCWLQALAKVNAESCTEMKGIRNDYIMLLVGYLVNKELKGPFEDSPTERLQPLTQAIATYIEKRKKGSEEKEGVPLNPVSDTIEAFMNHVPKIEEGAFAFLSLSGNIFTSQR